MCLDLVLFLAPNVTIFEKTVDYKWVKCPKSGCFKIYELNAYFYRVFYGLSENLKLKNKTQVIAILKGSDLLTRLEHYIITVAVVVSE